MHYLWCWFEEAKLNAKEAIELYIESLIEHGEEIPSDDDVLEYNPQLFAWALSGAWIVKARARLKNSS